MGETTPTPLPMPTPTPSEALLPPLRALIVDDEPRARNILRLLLDAHCPQVTVVAEAADLPSARRAVDERCPDLVFLDIELSGGSGFELLEGLPDFAFDVVFTTAYSEYALRAFEAAAVDYLLKPLQPQALVRAVQRVQRVRGSATGPDTPRPSLLPPDEADIAANVDTETEDLSPPQGYMPQAAADYAVRKLAVPHATGVHLLLISQLVLLEGQGAYTRIVNRDGRELLASRSLGAFEHLLNYNQFFRPHRSYIINLDTVVEFRKDDGGAIALEGHHLVPLSRRQRDAFWARLGVM